MFYYLAEAGGEEWMNAQQDDRSEPEDLVEFGGRICYRSWKPGLNPNVTKVRADHDEYLRNILKQKHGSVLEHVSYSFVFRNVSRVLTHELVRPPGRDRGVPGEHAVRPAGRHSVLVP